jgi:ribosomal protein S18 acetylase RimI-like enzyme
MMRVFLTYILLITASLSSHENGTDVVVNAFSLSMMTASSTSSKPTTNNDLLPNLFSSVDKDKNNNDIVIEIANISKDIETIRDCRQTVDFARNTNLLSSQKSFLNATALTKDSENIICIVAREGKIIVGTTDCRIGKDKVTVTNVYVRPDQRGKGIGEKMMVDGVEKLLLLNNKTNIPKKVFLNVYTNNIPAVRLYQKCGYQVSDPANAFVFQLAELTGANLQVGMTLTVN